MHLRKRYRTLLGIVILLIVVKIYVHFSYKSFAYYTNQAWNPVVKCDNTKQHLQQLVDLTHDVHHILKKMDIEHWLIYGSIWGAKRVEGPLPWDNDVDIGFSGESYSFSSRSLDEFLKPFKDAGMSVNNKWRQSGTITISKKNLPLSLDLFAFYEHNGWKKRTGIEPWLFFLNYNYYHTFPSWTVEPPLPEVRFGHFNISIPKGEFTALKFLYRDNWWTELKPKGC